MSLFNSSTVEKSLPSQPVSTNEEDCTYCLRPKWAYGAEDPCAYSDEWKICRQIPKTVKALPSNDSPFQLAQRAETERLREEARSSFCEGIGGTTKCAVFLFVGIFALGMVLNVRAYMKATALLR